jgi:hypothetical protein
MNMAYPLSKSLGFNSPDSYNLRGARGLSDFDDRIAWHITVIGIANTLRLHVSGPIAILGSMNRRFDAAVFSERALAICAAAWSFGLASAILTFHS